jgi:hypothetical protein
MNLGCDATGREDAVFRGRFREGLDLGAVRLEAADTFADPRSAHTKRESLSDTQAYGRLRHMLK